MAHGSNLFICTQQSYCSLSLAHSSLLCPKVTWHQSLGFRSEPPPFPSLRCLVLILCRLSRPRPSPVASRHLAAGGLPRRRWTSAPSAPFVRRCRRPPSSAPSAAARAPSAAAVAATSTSAFASSPLAKIYRSRIHLLRLCWRRVFTSRRGRPHPRPSALLMPCGFLPPSAHLSLLLCLWAELCSAAATSSLVFGLCFLCYSLLI